MENTIAKIGHNKTLSQYALEIRDLLLQISKTDQLQATRRVTVGKLLLEVINTHFPKYFDKKSLTDDKRYRAQFYLWCEKNLLNEKGKPYSKGHIDSYIFTERHSKHFAATARVKRRLLPTDGTLAAKNSAPVHDQLNALQTVWERTTIAAREHFMRINRLRYE